MFKNHFTLAYLLAALMFVGNIFAERGDLISHEILATRNVDNTQTYIDNELAQIVTDMFSIEPAQYGYWLYKITYETIDLHGNLNIASGSISFPRVDWPSLPNHQAFPVISYQHGTVVEKSSVTSVNGEWILPAILTGSGYVYVEPDYLGLGSSEGRHPYQLNEPYGTSVVDMLRAVRQFANENDQFTINDQLFLAGYSEGGYATMAVHRIIERDYAEEFNITVSFPMAGAYSMSGIMVDLMLDQEPYGEPFYFPYVLFSYLESYPMIGELEEYILPEYVFLHDLFDGYHSSGEINASMPDIPITIMIPEEITYFEQNQNHPLRIYLEENDLWNWLPQAPMHIFHGEGDELVPFANAQLAYDQFLANGAQDVYLEPIPESFGGHQDVAPWALFGAYQVSQDVKIINELGDVNQDGVLNILDLVGIANVILDGSNSNVDNYAIWASDVNMDAEIDILDIISLVNIILDN